MTERTGLCVSRLKDSEERRKRTGLRPKQIARKRGVRGSENDGRLAGWMHGGNRDGQREQCDQRGKTDGGAQQAGKLAIIVASKQAGEQASRQWRQQHGRDSREEFPPEAVEEVESEDVREHHPGPQSLPAFLQVGHGQPGRPRVIVDALLVDREQEHHACGRGKGRSKAI